MSDMKKKCNYILSKTDKANIVKEYLKGLSSTKLSLKYNVTPSAILSILKNRKIKRRNRSDAARKLSLDINAFQNSNNEEVAYWAGFLLADGSVIKIDNSYQISLVLHQRDRNHIVKFKRFLKSEHKISKNRVFSVLNVRSRKLGLDLINLGVIPNKTYKDSKIHKQLLNNRHFWRGVVDGDGSLCFCNKYPVLNLMGRENLLREFLMFIQYFFPMINTKIIPIKNEVCRIFFRANTAKRVTYLLYHEANVFLDRKMDMALKILNWVSKKNQNMLLSQMAMR